MNARMSCGCVLPSAFLVISWVQTRVLVADSDNGLQQGLSGMQSRGQACLVWQVHATPLVIQVQQI